MLTSSVSQSQDAECQSDRRESRCKVVSGDWYKAFRLRAKINVDLSTNMARVSRANWLMVFRENRRYLPLTRRIFADPEQPTA